MYLAVPFCRLVVTGSSCLYNSILIIVTVYSNCDSESILLCTCGFHCLSKDVLSGLKMEESELPCCSIHVQLKQVFYCLECEELLCRRCMMDNHRLHNYDETEVVADRKNLVLKDLMKSAESKLAEGKLVINCSEKKAQLATYHQELEMSLQYYFEKVFKQLHDRKKYLLAYLQNLIDKEHKKIEATKNDFVRLVSKLESNIVTAKRLTSDTNNIPVIMDEKQLALCFKQEIENITNLCASVTFDKKYLQIIFKEEDDTELCNVIDRLGTIICSGEVVPLNDSPGPLRDVSHLAVSRSDSGNSLVHVSVVNDMKMPAAILSCAEKGQTFHPCGIAVGSNNLITVSDLHNNSVKVLTSTGKVIDTIESGNVSHAFKGPCALHVDRNNDIYILEKDVKGIQKYTNGLLVELGKFKQFSDPRGIFISDDRVYVTDWKNNCIHVLNLNSNKLFYNSVIGENFLKQPAGIACVGEESKGRIIVADQENHCVWVMTPEGDIISCIGKKGSSPGMLSNPYGVAVTIDGNLVVSEKGNSRISLFSMRGSFVSSFGCKGSDPGQFNQVRHLCINSTGQLLVADEVNQRVQIFDL